MKYHPPTIIVSKHVLEVREYLTKLHPDSITQPYEMTVLTPEGNSLTIDQIRDFRREIQCSGSSPRIIIFELFEQATFEAQHALLKFLEDLAATHSFYIFTSSLESVIPTIRSRCKIIVLKDDVYLSEKI